MGDKIFIVSKGVDFTTWRKTLSRYIDECTLVKVTPKGKRITTPNGNTFIYLDKSYEFFDTYADAVAHVLACADKERDGLLTDLAHVDAIIAECKE